MPLCVTAVLLGLLGAALIAVQPYSADWPGTAYAKPSRQYLRAALRRDSAALLRLSASPSAVKWALDAGRLHGDSLALWADRLQAYRGERRGDTAEVFVYPVYPTEDGCADKPIVLEFVGTGSGTRVVHASATCWRR